MSVGVCLTQAYIFIHASVYKIYVQIDRCCCLEAVFPFQETYLKTTENLRSLVLSFLNITNAY